MADTKRKYPTWMFKKSTEEKHPPNFQQSMRPHKNRKADKAIDRMRRGNQVHNTWTPFTHPDCSQDDIWGINGKRYAKRQMVRRHRLEGQRKVTLLINAICKYILQG